MLRNGLCVLNCKISHLLESRGAKGRTWEKSSFKFSWTVVPGNGFRFLEASILSVLMNLDRVLYAQKREPRGAETPVPSPGKRRGVTKAQRGFIHPCNQPAPLPGFDGDCCLVLTASQSLVKGKPPLPPSMWSPFKIETTLVRIVVQKLLKTLCHPYSQPPNILYIYRTLHNFHSPFLINDGFEFHDKSLR